MSSAIRKRLVTILCPADIICSRPNICAAAKQIGRESSIDFIADLPVPDRRQRLGTCPGQQNRKLYRRAVANGEPIRLEFRDDIPVIGRNTGRTAWKLRDLPVGNRVMLHNVICAAHPTGRRVRTARLVSANKIAGLVKETVTV